MNKKHIIGLAIILLLGIIAYANSFGNQFVWDDNSLVVNNTLITKSYSLKKIFSTHLFYGSAKDSNFYRPIQTLSFLLDYRIWKLNPVGYHITNTLLHIFVALLLYCFLWLAFNNIRIALFTALLFIVHPIHTEAVVYISGRSDSLAAIFLLSSIIFIIKYNRSRKLIFYLISISAFILALLSRENALIFPLLLSAYKLTFDSKKENIKFSIIPFFVVMCVYILLRLTMLRFSIPVEASLKLPLSYRLLNLSQIIFIYFGFLLFPIGQHMERTINIYTSVQEPIIIFSGIGLLSIILFIMKISRAKFEQKMLFFGIMWFFINILPYLNIVPINAALAEHWLYISSIGFFLILATYFTRLPKNFGIYCLLCLIALYSSATILQNRYWENEFTLYHRILKFSPKSDRVHYNLGLAYAKNNDTEKAIAEFKKAIELKPDYVDAYIDLGYAYQQKRRINNAEETFKKAIELKPDSYMPYYYLANLYNDVNQASRAIELYKKAISLKKDDPDIYFDLGRAYDKTGDVNNAIKAYQKTIEIDPVYIDAYINLGSLLAQQKRLAEARIIWEKGVKIDPNEPYLKQNLDKLKRIIR